LRLTLAASPILAHGAPSSRAWKPGIDGISLAAVCTASIRINPARCQRAGNASWFSCTQTHRPGTRPTVASRAREAAGGAFQGDWTISALGPRGPLLPRCAWYIYAVEYYAAVKKKDLLPFATAWMDLESIMLSEISQSEKDKCHVISLMWNLMNKIDWTK
ncbi:hypothetical protein MDA_GLEAN10005827, partial [Myotis davidii]